VAALREKLTTFVVVTLVTLTIWLFAEAESLGHESLPCTVEIAAADSSRDVSPTTGWDGRVTLDISGSRRALEQVRDLLSQPVRLTLPSTMPEGEQSLDLLEAMQVSESLVRSGVTIESVRPLRAGVLVQEIVTRQVPIRAELPGVQVSGQIAVTPDKADVRLPRVLADRLGDALAVVARVPSDQRSRLDQPGPVAVQAEIVLPESITKERGVQLLTQRASLAFSIKSTLTTANFAFPVQVLTLPIEWGDWTVEIRDEDERLNVELTGPSDVIDRLKSPEERLIAVLALSSDDLAKKATSKDASFGVVRDGVFSPLPAGVQVKADRRTVRFEVKKRGEP
jgi:hypothetical protein